MSRTTVEDNGKIFPFSNTGFFCEQTRCFWYSSTHRTVSHRRLFCHFVTNSWLLQSNTQTHHLSPCVCVCAWVEVHCFRFENSFILLVLFSVTQPWISITEVIKSNENKRDWLNINQCMRNTEFLKCGSFYFAMAVPHSLLHVAETLWPTTVGWMHH